MPVWEYKIISSGKGGFATPAHLESFLNQLGKDEWEILAFHTQPDNLLAISGLARRSTQRDWTLEDAAAAAARAEADKLRAEFEAKFRGSAGGAAVAAEAGPGAEPEAAGGENSFRRLRDTEHDQDPDAPDEAGEDEWDKLGNAEEALPTFFEAIRPHMRRNQRGPGLSVGVDYLAKKWEFSEEDVLEALKECGFAVPEDEDSKPVYLEYDGDLFWVNINRRGELWINTKEKPRAVFRTVTGVRVAPEPESAEHPASSAQADPAAGGGESAAPARQAPAPRPGRGSESARSAAPAQPLPEGEAILDRIRPLMRRNRREPGGSGSIQFLARALKSSEEALVAALTALGPVLPEAHGEKAAEVSLGGYLWWLNRDSRGGIWINAREQRDGEAAGGHGSAQAGTETQAGDGALAGEAVAEGHPAGRDRPAGDGGDPAFGAGAEPAAGESHRQAAEEAGSFGHASSEGAGSAAGASPGHVLAAVRLLMRGTRTGGLAATVDRLAGELGRSGEELVNALVAEGLRVPEKAREKPVFVEHAGEIFWFNRNARGELWVNAKESRFAEPAQGEGSTGGRGRRPRRRGPASDAAAPAGSSEGPESGLPGAESSAADAFGEGLDAPESSAASGLASAGEEGGAGTQSGPVASPEAPASTEQ